jgi:hypothetical protein
MAKAKKKTAKKKGKTVKKGRPEIQFDLKEITKLGVLHATNQDMAGWLDVHVDTIDDRMNNDDAFSGAYKSGRGKGNCSLRRKQHELASNGNVPLLIWLGKQYLGQVEKVEAVQSEAAEDLQALIKAIRKDRRKNG